MEALTKIIALMAAYRREDRFMLLDLGEQLDGKCRLEVSLAKEKRRRRCMVFNGSPLFPVELIFKEGKTWGVETGAREPVIF